MFLDGNVSSFASRLHQLVENVDDLSLYIVEGNGYILAGLADVGLVAKWEKEARLRKFILTNSGTDLTTQLFGIDNPSEPLLDELGEELLDEFGEAILSE